uniref:Uncharacterized protein n=1 Tax=Aegilops tauschii subsp. strangulata TaxID=200361 RepID=A0A452Z862_AEGTS
MCFRGLWCLTGRVLTGFVSLEGLIIAIASRNQLML